MSEFLNNHPGALELHILYEITKWRTADKSLGRLRRILGRDAISKEEFMETYQEMTKWRRRTEFFRRIIRENVLLDPTTIRVCIVSDAIDKKPVAESYDDISKLTRVHIDYPEFDYCYYHKDFIRPSNQTTFSMIPVEILGKIAEKADFKSQLNLRQASSCLQKIVDRERPAICCITYEHYDMGDFIEICDGHYDRFGRVIHENREESFNCWAKYLVNPLLSLTFLQYHNPSRCDLNEKIMDLLTGLEHKIPVEELLVDVENEDLLVAFLDVAKPGILKSLDFRVSNEELDVERLAEMEQWKGMKKINVGFPPIHYSEAFWHLEEFELNLKGVSIRELLVLRDISLANPNFKTCTIYTLNKPSIEGITDNLDIIQCEFPHPNFFVGNYEIPGSKYKLEFRLTMDFVEINRVVSGGPCTWFQDHFIHFRLRN